MKAFVLAGLIGLALAAAGSAQAGPAPLTADIKDAKGATLGTLTLTGAPRGVLLTVEVKGLPPGVHGMHFHEKGSCAEPKFESAGGHVHGMAGTRHGLMNADATDDGDLPNLHVAADGTATVELYSTLVRLDAADDAAPALLDADGSSLIIHANPDDYTTQPIGGAGARIACAVIK